MREAARGLGLYAVMVLPTFVFAAWFQQVDMTYHTRSIRERSELKARLDAIEARQDRQSKRIDAALKAAGAFYQEP